ncbi:RICIN domain-containing protein [Paenibacillus larvae]|nr:RICIN domain-containing protein [Paenibacillus larvae]MDT2236561.1 RICIN domain-containing protein [Paenibacillus larvae]
MYQIVTALNDTSVFDLNGPNHVTLWENNRGDHQKWKFVYNRDKNAYQIKSVSDKNLVLAWNAIPNSKQVFATPNQYKEEHYWILEECKDGYYIIKNKKIRLYSLISLNHLRFFSCYKVNNSYTNIKRSCYTKDINPVG